MAETLIKQRVDSATKAVNEKESLLVEDVRRNVQKDKNLDKTIKAVASLTEKVGAKQAAIAEEYKKKIQALSEEAKIQSAKIQVELDTEKTKLDALKGEIEHEIGKRASGIKQKAAEVRMNLNQELNRLNDQLYATILPANLLAVVDQAPKIGEEGKFVALEFKQ